MARFRKKPIIINAFKLGTDFLPDWCLEKITDNTIILYRDREISSPFDHDHKVFADIKTLEGVMKADHGDYIIQGIKGEIYPCKPEIFEKTYELIEGEI